MDIAILHYSLAPVVGGVERLIEDQEFRSVQYGADELHFLRHALG